jgi:hypothetical protein
VRCYHAALRAFREALAGDRLELILGRSASSIRDYCERVWKLQATASVAG